MALGGIFLSLFGATWLCGAGYEYAGPNLPLLAAIVIGALALTAWAVATFRARRRSFAGASDAAAGQRVRKVFMIVNAVQWTGIGLAVLLLNLTGHVAWILPVVIWIVGVHFFPLARLFRYQGYILTGLALILVSVLTLLYGSEIGASIALTLLATGAILWLTAVVLLRAV
jgi:uncharacterized membrane protein YecN with MAPEG domain